MHASLRSLVGVVTLLLVVVCSACVCVEANAGGGSPRPLPSLRVAPADNLVLRINRHIFSHAPKPPSSTPMSRVNSISMIAMHDAAAAVLDQYQPVYPVERLRGQTRAANFRAAILSAFNTTRLVGMQRLPSNYKADQLLFSDADLLPYTSALETFVEEQLAIIRASGDSAANIEAGWQLGVRVAERTNVLRETDGYNVPAPIQDFDCGITGKWCSWTEKNTKPADARGAGYPNWGGVQPFSFDAASDFTVPAPPQLGDALFDSSLNQTKLFGRKGSNDAGAAWQKEVHVWSLGAGGELAARLVDSLFSTLALEQREVDTLAALGRLYVGNADAMISNLYNKYLHNSWRPFQAIRQSGGDPEWVPTLNTPVNQEYPCGHCQGTAGALTGLSLFLGFDEFPSGASVPFIVPGQQATPSFTSFGEVLQHVNQARMYGGMHFQFSIATGSALGAKISTKIHETMFLPKSN